jgi:4-amino-4-deoxy-L-arabinose transferase-like glycosyltransferase
LIVVLLWGHFFMRSHHSLALDAFVDEGYHLTRAAIVWDFETHPARFANGKLLLYFWLGLFETDPQAALLVGRLALALFSLLSAALIYRLGHLLADEQAGLWAMGLYVMLPFAFFFERMALADPFASVFAMAVAWQSWRLARHPTLKNGLCLGLWLALATLAKLTMGLLPLLAVVACALEHPWSGQWRADLGIALRRYYPALQVAAIVMIVCWLPILIPAALAIGSDDPFTLVNAENLQYVNQIEPLQELSEVLPNSLAYVGTSFVMLSLLIPVMLLFAPAPLRLRGFFLLIWMACIMGLPFIAASEIRSRYLMPLAPPWLLLLVLALHWLRTRAVWGYRVMSIALLLWVLGFALPFARHLMLNPNTTPLDQGDYTRYLSGNFTGPALQAAGLALNDLPNERIYATWGSCQTLYFYSERPVTCLNPPSTTQTPNDDLAERLPVDFVTYQAVLVVLNDLGGAPFDIPGTDWHLVASFPRDSLDRPVNIWQVSAESAANPE